MATDRTKKNEKACGPSHGFVLVLTVARGHVLTIPLPASGALTIGRGGDADISLDHGSISRRHARLLSGPSVRIQDLGSTNGTRVQGKELGPDDAVALDIGSVVELGNVMGVVCAPDRSNEARLPLRHEPSAPAPHSSDAPLLGP